MPNNVIRRTRVLLIEIGKVLPFLVCAIVMLSYMENLLSLMTHDYVIYKVSLVLNKSFSWTIGSFFEYNLITIVMLYTIGISVETCLMNKIATTYLLLQLGEKSYFSTIELYEEYIYAIVILNIAISGFLLYKGIKQIK